MLRVMRLHADLRVGLLLSPFAGWFVAFSDGSVGEKKTGIGSTLKGLYANDLEIAFLKNLAQKRGF